MPFISAKSFMSVRKTVVCEAHQYRRRLRQGVGIVDATYLDDFAHAAAGFFENGLHAFAWCLCLVGDAAFDQVAVLVGGDLARDEDVLADLDCLALFDGVS
jgi:hypothetical protein